MNIGVQREVSPYLSLLDLHTEMPYGGNSLSASKSGAGEEALGVAREISCDDWDS